MENQILELLMKEDEITWQTIIQNLVKSEEMDPWDVDVSKLTNSYLAAVKKLEQMNFSISGKVILAAALLLKMKSSKLVEEDLLKFEYLINPPEELIEQEPESANLEIEENQVVVIPKIPQPRRRKVSIEDLVSALHQALEVNKRRVLKQLDELNIPRVILPEKKVDITQLIKEIYSKIVEVFRTNETLTFSQFVNSDRKEDKISTFIPLLHLDVQKRILLEQKEHFGEIEITLPKKLYYQSSFDETQNL